MLTYQAIETKYLGPTNTRGSRVKATAQSGSRTIPWDNARNSDENHKLAAQVFATKRGWMGKWYAGCTAQGRYVFVCTAPHAPEPAFEIGEITQ